MRGPGTGAAGHSSAPPTSSRPGRPAIRPATRWPNVPSAARWRCARKVTTPGWRGGARWPPRGTTSVPRCGTRTPRSRSIRTASGRWRSAWTRWSSWAATTRRSRRRGTPTRCAPASRPSPGSRTCGSCTATPTAPGRCWTWRCAPPGNPTTSRTSPRPSATWRVGRASTRKLCGITGLRCAPSRGICPPWKAGRAPTQRAANWARRPANCAKWYAATRCRPPWPRSARSTKRAANGPPLSASTPWPGPGWTSRTPTVWPSTWKPP